MSIWLVALLSAGCLLIGFLSGVFFTFDHYYNEDEH